MRIDDYDLLVFDWDGTLFDSTATIVHALQAAFADLGLPLPDDDAARHVIGLGLAEAMQTLRSGLTAEQYRLLVAAYRHHYLTQADAVTLFAGVADSLRRWSAEQRLLAVATGKNRAGLDRALVQSGLSDFFVATRTVDECPSKPHPEMLLSLMDVTGVSAERTLMIGDTTHDLWLARNAGCHAVGVSYGAHPLGVLEELSPLTIVHSFFELSAWLQSN
jgi:phosphoglycolate phosphatase